MKVFYDGECPICYREISRYRKLETEAFIQWVDIKAPGFDPGSEGLDPEKIDKKIHIKDASGRVFTGIDGLIEIWKRIPKLKIRGVLFSKPGLRQLAGLGYAVLAKTRRLLPKIKTCEPPL